MGEKGPMTIYADEKENVPCPKAFGEVPLRSCEVCSYKWALGSVNGMRSVDCSMPMEMTAEKLERYEEFRDFCYRSGKVPRQTKEDDEVDAIVDSLQAGLHPHLRSETD
jgi:hypothetical protein